jgi:hypothetical protein
MEPIESKHCVSFIGSMVLQGENNKSLTSQVEELTTPFINGLACGSLSFCILFQSNIYISYFPDM